MHGRRRVGKTELIETHFHGRPILKFEGLEEDYKGTRRSPKLEQRRQITECLRRLGNYTEQKEIYRNIKCETWSEFFEILDSVMGDQEIILYFEEVQWLAAFKDNFFAEMKTFWDDKWSRNCKLRLVICGSSPSFIVGQFLSNKALYNRNNEMFAIEPFTLPEISEYLGKKGPREALLAALCVGGIPSYLHQVKHAPSVLLGVAENSFSKNGFFVEEYNRIFVSSLAQNSFYKKILRLLSKKKFMTRDELSQAISGKTESGGTLTTIIDDLQKCGFIKGYSSVHLEKPSDKLVRYSISEPFLIFYHRFIEPKLAEIEGGKFDDKPLSAISNHAFKVAMGFSFEQWCRNNSRTFAKILGFEGVEYNSGAFFHRTLEKETPGFQIDLIYIRQDSKIIICECKYYNDYVSKNVVKEVVKKQSLFMSANPKYKNYTYESLLITTEGLSPDDEQYELFDHVITFDDFVK